MKRREFIAGLAGSVASPLVGWAQEPDRVARIGYLGFLSASAGRIAFETALRDLGYEEGRNLHIEYRFAEGDMDRLPALAAELATQNVQAIVTYASGVYAVQHETTKIPIVMATGADVVAMGTVNSLAHPGGNITGLTFFLPELMAKRLALLKEAVPSISRAAVLLLRNNPSTANVLETMRSSAKALRFELRPTEIIGPNDLEDAFARWDEEQVDGIVMLDHAQVLAQAHLISALAKKYALPSIGPVELPSAGGLMGYGVNFSDMFRRAATFVDKILKGAKPSELPIEQATSFKFMLNLKAAKDLHLEIAPSLLARADEVIE